MSSNQLGPAGRFLLAAAASCAFVAPWAGVRAEEPSAAGGSDEVVRPIVESPTARAAARPTVRISYAWIGSARDTARFTIRFSQAVTGFDANDFTITCPHVAPALCPQVASVTSSGTSGSVYSAKLGMPRNYDGFVYVQIPPNAAHNNANPPQGNYVLESPQH